MPSDLPEILAVAKEVHPAFPEDAEVFAERLCLYTAGCLVFHAGRTIAGYVISHQAGQGSAGVEFIPQRVAQVT